LRCCGQRGQKEQGKVQKAHGQGPVLRWFGMSLASVGRDGKGRPFRWTPLCG
jgi:hypothetical protein